MKAFYNCTELANLEFLLMAKINKWVISKSQSNECNSIEKKKKNFTEIMIFGMHYKASSIHLESYVNEIRVNQE